MSDATTTYREAVASEVRALMGRRRISQTRLAKALGMSQSALSRRLTGVQPFDTDDLYKLAALFDVEVTALLGTPYTAWFTAGSPETRDAAGAAPDVAAETVARAA